MDNIEIDDVILYPEHDDTSFKEKIASKKEFNQDKFISHIPYTGEPLTEQDIDGVADKLCNSTFELAPHQLFVRNFLSFSSPYNSLLLYHGLGSGKTCSAITICEEMRTYNKQMNSKQKIFIVASPNVQENFRVQLFNPDKLERKNTGWTVTGCVGESLLHEVNPTNSDTITKEILIKQINKTINTSYLFVGYTKFANIIKSAAGNNPRKNLSKIFNDSLVIIDEAHNVRTNMSEKDKTNVDTLDFLVENTDSMRLCLLSGTPMYNDSTEIVWLLNLLNKNDGREPIDRNEIFDSMGNFKESDGNPVGKLRLIEHMQGYVSYVRGDNPFTFPYKLYPSMFSDSNTITVHPEVMLNDTEIQLQEKLKYLDLFMCNLSEYQDTVYTHVINSLKATIEKEALEKMDSFGYIFLEKPIMCLNITYPIVPLEIVKQEIEKNDTTTIANYIGSKGLEETMDFTVSKDLVGKENFEYKENILNEHGRFFKLENIKEYSSKIFNICTSILNAKQGINLIYSEHIDGGIIPMVLALEECGFTRYGRTPSLFKEPPPDVEKQGKYVVISGNKTLSPNNVDDIAAANRRDNIDGSKVRVIIISRAGAEGLDFRGIRQIHVMEPWYNMNRPEQIIGRGVRTCSHSSLPYNQRNVMIFLYASYLNDINSEAVDFYVYRKAEQKAVKIGEVTRVLKANSVDCILNKSQMDYASDKLNATVTQITSTGIPVRLEIGDKPFSSMCDYMEKCEYIDDVDKERYDEILSTQSLDRTTYNISFLEFNVRELINRIKLLFKQEFIYDIEAIFTLVRQNRDYTEEQIYNALTIMLEDSNIHLIDKYNRIGHLINIDELYMFSPIELNDVYDKESASKPLDYKIHKLTFAKQESQRLEGEEEREKQDQDLKEELYSTLENLSVKIEITKIPQDIKMIEAKQDTTWYSYMSYYMKTFNSDTRITSKDIQAIIYDHLFEEITYNTKLLILNSLKVEASTLTENKKFIKLFNNILMQAREYFKKHIIVYNKESYIMLFNEDVKDSYALHRFDYETDKWEPLPIAIFNDLITIKDFQKLFRKCYNVIKPTSINNLYGCMKKVKKTDTKNVFKLFYTMKSTTGVNCSTRTSHLSQSDLDFILDGNEEYRDIIFKSEMNNQIGLCLMNEVLLRYFNMKKINKKTWFLTDIEHAINLKELNNIKKKN